MNIGFLAQQNHLKSQIRENTTLFLVVRAISSISHDFVHPHTCTVLFFFPRVSLDFIIELYTPTTNVIYLSTIVRL